MGNPKAEIRNPKEARRSNSETVAIHGLHRGWAVVLSLGLRNSDFIRISDFGFELRPHALNATDATMTASGLGVPVRRCSISSSGTPLVSGTISFTQRRCRTIMPQKNRK